MKEKKEKVIEADEKDVKLIKSKEDDIPEEDAVLMLSDTVPMLIISAAALILGIFMVIAGASLSAALNIILTGAFIALGVIQLIRFIKKRKEISFYAGAISLAVGIIVLFKSEFIIIISSIVFAAFFFVMAIIKLRLSFKDGAHFAFLLWSAIASVTLGMTMMWFPIANTEDYFRILGVCFIIEAALNFICFFAIKLTPELQLGKAPAIIVSLLLTIAAAVFLVIYGTNVNFGFNSGTVNAYGINSGTSVSDGTSTGALSKRADNCYVILIEQSAISCEGVQFATVAELKRALLMINDENTSVVVKEINARHQITVDVVAMLTEMNISYTNA